MSSFHINIYLVLKIYLENKNLNVIDQNLTFFYLKKTVAYREQQKDFFH